MSHSLSRSAVWTALAVSLLSLSPAYASQGLRELVTGADSIVLAKVLSARAEKPPSSIGTSTSVPTPIVVKLKILESLKGSVLAGRELEIELPDALVIGGEKMLWFLPVASAGPMKPLPGNGLMRVWEDSARPGIEIALGGDKNRGLWSNAEDAKLWDIVDREKFKGFFNPQSDLEAQLVFDIAKRKCTPNPVPYALLKAAILTLDSESKTAAKP